MRKVIERCSGQEFAAKFIQVREEGEKEFFKLEMDALVRQTSGGAEVIHDAFETSKQVIIVCEKYPWLVYWNFVFLFSSLTFIRFIQSVMFFTF